MRLQLNFAILIGLIFILMLPEISYAHHPYSPKRHMTSTHSTINHEYFCADVKESSVSISSAYNELKRILYNRNYDGLAGNKIYLVASNTNLNCSDMSASILNGYYLRYYIEANTQPRCDGTSSCIVRYGPTQQSDGHTHYAYAVVTIREQTWNNLREYIVNHETGHFLGLRDGSGSSNCPGSIMHSKDYGCSNGYPANPYQNDLNTVISEANSN